MAMHAPLIELADVEKVDRVGRLNGSSLRGIDRIGQADAPERDRRGRPADPGHAQRNHALDGLRFLAVAAVVAFHLAVPGAQGGFLGVDLFFVLSGFLITRILLRQVESGRIRLGDFWTRRVRRLAPAIVLALAAVIAWGALDASMTSRDALRADVTATLAYVANWHFIASSSYFHATGDPSPLLHMWTLAVEEQFYVLWPLALFIIVLLIPPRARLKLIAAVALSGVLVSAWRLHALWVGSESSDRAYMGTDSRMFGPLVGALVAIVLMHAPRLGASRRANTALMASGSVILVWGMLALASANGVSVTYPRGGALLFALGAGGVIWALSTRTSRASRVLALPPITYLGRISYGIYIWHWPLIIWAGEGRIDTTVIPTVPRTAVLTAAIVAAAALSYHVVEKPIRYGTIGRKLTGRWIVVLLPAVLGTLIAINSAVVVPHAGAEILVVAPSVTQPGVTQPGVTKPRVTKRGVAKPRANVAAVTKTVILVGDSVPQALGRAFADAGTERGYVVIRATAGGCPATAVGKVTSSGERLGKNTCPRVAAEQDTKIRKYRPALVIWWSRYEVAPRLGKDGKLLPLGSRAYRRAQQASFEARARALTKRGARLVTVQIERPGRALAVRNPAEKYFLPGQSLLHRRDVVRAWNAFLARHRGPRVFSISIDRLVCGDSRNPCDDRLPNGETARPDGVHYSDRAGRRLALQILEAALRITRIESLRTS